MCIYSPMQWGVDVSMKDFLSKKKIMAKPLLSVEYGWMGISDDGLMDGSMDK